MTPLAERTRIKLRIAQATATTKYTVGGKLKVKQPRPITLPKLEKTRRSDAPGKV